MPDGRLQKNTIAAREEEILRFWEKKKIFEKSLGARAGGKEFVFYDGPPFANGLPHYGHILTSFIKDAIPRYMTMRGFFVPRRWGWDCHGLPVEIEVEKALGLRAKKDIEMYGIEKFNEKAAENVMNFAAEWRRQIPRIGRWVDMDRDYRTMDVRYTETVWWIFKKLLEKGLIYEGFKSVHICPRCETTLSNFEVSQGYRDTVDLSLYIKFKLIGTTAASVGHSGITKHLLVWTTTPWTLPGNVALAVRSDLRYVTVGLKGEKGDEYLIVAKERAPAFLGEGQFEVIEEFGGEALVGSSYEPPFDYFAGEVNNRDRAWRIYDAPFVSAEEGTGIVHIAPAFGEDDLALAQREKLPLIHHVRMDGRFTEEVQDFAGLAVKPSENPSETDQKIAENLKEKGLVFRLEEIHHSYPHCWRCDWPLLNYATSSWFVRVTRLKEKLIAENKRIRWVPEYIGRGRFGGWLRDVRDWAISRSRYWGAPIPVWKCGKCARSEIIGSLAELGSRISSGNRYFVMRHGEAENNRLGVLSTDENRPHHLTEFGRRQVEEVGMTLRRYHIDLIFVSPFPRTRETAEIIARLLSLSPDSIHHEVRLRELKGGQFDGRAVKEYQGFFSSPLERFTKRPVGGETYEEIKQRVGLFISELEQMHRGKRILIITHDAPGWLLFSVAAGLTPKEAVMMRGESDYFLPNGVVRELYFARLPKNRRFELNLHRPYIDEIELVCSCGGSMKRIPEVFDCWFESGSMPYASHHYPFENRDVFEPGRLLLRAKRFPADFIAEGIDQTRGWFYSLLVLGVALFGRAPYRTVLVNGTILGEDGQKMSKRLKNYRDPMDVVGRYGADSLRYYLFSSPVVHGEEIRFSEHAVKEVMQKVLDRLTNVFLFYEMYAEDSKSVIKNNELPQAGIPQSITNSKHVLDRWIVARLDEVVSSVTKAMEVYELDRAVRPIGEFIEDLSTWYLRRSRDRFKKESEQERTLVAATTRSVLLELSKIAAPFLPFLSEEIYQKLKGVDGRESVHLEDWPRLEARFTVPNAAKIIEQMAEVRRIVSLSHEARSRTALKVRQPLMSLRVKNIKVKLTEEFLALIQDEVNVKEVIFDDRIGEEVDLDTTLTEELREEGKLRELTRRIQDLRRSKGFVPRQIISIIVDTNEGGRRFIERNQPVLLRAASLSGISFRVNEGEIIEIDDLRLRVTLE